MSYQTTGQLKDPIIQDPNFKKYENISEKLSPISNSLSYEIIKNSEKLPRNSKDSLPKITVKPNFYNLPSSQSVNDIKKLQNNLIYAANIDQDTKTRKSECYTTTQPSRRNEIHPENQIEPSHRSSRSKNRTNHMSSFHPEPTSSSTKNSHKNTNQNNNVQYERKSRARHKTESLATNNNNNTKHDKNSHYRHLSSWDPYSSKKDRYRYESPVEDTDFDHIRLRHEARERISKISKSVIYNEHDLLHYDNLMKTLSQSYLPVLKGEKSEHQYDKEFKLTNNFYQKNEKKFGSKNTSNANDTRSTCNNLQQPEIENSKIVSNSLTEDQNSNVIIVNDMNLVNQRTRSTGEIHYPNLSLSRDLSPPKLEIFNGKPPNPHTTANLSKSKRDLVEPSPKVKAYIHPQNLLQRDSYAQAMDKSSSKRILPVGSRYHAKSNSIKVGDLKDQISKLQHCTREGDAKSKGRLQKTEDLILAIAKSFFRSSNEDNSDFYKDSPENRVPMNNISIVNDNSVTYNIDNHGFINSIG